MDPDFYTETDAGCYYNYVGYAAVTIFLVPLVYFACWYWNLRRSYSNFPSYSFDVELFCNWISGKLPRNKTFSNYFFHECVSKFKHYGKEGLCLVWGIQPFLTIYKEEYIKIFSNDLAAVKKTPFAYNIVEELIGKGLLTNNGEVWKERRKMLNPGFRFQLLKTCVTVMNQNAHLIVEELTQKCGKPADVLDILKTGSLKMLCESILGIKLNTKRHETLVSRYIEILSKLGNYTIYRVPRPWLYGKYFQLLFQVGRQHWKLYKEFHNLPNVIIEELMDSMSSKANSGTETSDPDKKSFACILLENHLKDPSITLDDIRDEFNNIIFAGHDTVSHTLLWCLFMLGHHPDVQDTAYEEVSALALQESNYSYSDINKMVYLECVIKETLRLFPAVPMYGRSLTRDVQCGKYKVPKNTVIVFIPYMLHRDPDTYPNPEKFDPDRFSKNSLKYPWAYIPFSEGIRSCIGKNFAMMEMKLVLAHLLKKFKIVSIDKREDVNIDWNILLAPAAPIHFLLTPRQPHLTQPLPKG